MQRSYLLSIDFKVPSLTEWVAQLKINPLYAILSGFKVNDIPAVYTYYNFMKRLWDSNDPHMMPHIHLPKRKKKVMKLLLLKSNSCKAPLSIRKFAFSP